MEYSYPYAQSSQAVGTSSTNAREYIHDGDIKLVRKGKEEYYHFHCNEKKYETRKSDWIEIPSEVDGQSCWVYKGKKTGTRYWRWTMDTVTTSYKGKDKGKGKGNSK